MVDKIFKNRYILTVLQLLSLVVFALLIFGAFGITTEDAKFAKTLRNTNMANLIVWSYWWPLIIVTAIFFGRFWCSICPMELITSFFGRFGLKKKPGRVLKSGWIITLFYLLILVIGIHTLEIHRLPHRMAIYLLILLGTAMVVGFLWEKRTFCTYVCPIGHLLGLYSLLSFKQLRVKDSDVCKHCKTKDCISKENHYKMLGRSCTSELYPPKILDNRACILCGQCYKSCINDNITIKKQSIATDLFKDIKLSWAEISFFVMVSGFVVYEIMVEWKTSKKILMTAPHWLIDQLQISGSTTGTVKALLLFVIIPTVFYLLLAWGKKQFAQESWKSAFTQLVLALLPVTASMHLLKALFKMSSRIPYWPFAVSDPKGVDSAQLILQNPDLLNTAWWIPTGVSTIAIVLPFLGLLLSYFIIKKQTHTSQGSIIISMLAALLYASVFISTLIIWKLG